MYVESQPIFLANTSSITPARERSHAKLPTDVTERYQPMQY